MKEKAREGKEGKEGAKDKKEPWREGRGQG